jgi:hypothetical protein
MRSAVGAYEILLPFIRRAILVVALQRFAVVLLFITEQRAAFA